MSHQLLKTSSITMHKTTFDLPDDMEQAKVYLSSTWMDCRPTYSDARHRFLQEHPTRFSTTTKETRAHTAHSDHAC